MEGFEDSASGAEDGADDSTKGRGKSSRAHLAFPWRVRPAKLLVSRYK
jgi:hypothetical protein